MMHKVLLAIVLLFWPLAAAHAQDWRTDRFAAADLTLAERRIVQAALVATGYYLGPLDGEWGEDSATALAAFAADQGHDVAQFADLVPLLDGFDAEWTEGGWQIAFVEEADTSFALPLGALTATGPKEGYAWEAAGGALSATFALEDREAAVAQHQLIYARRAATSDRYQLNEPDRLITSVTLKDGHHAFVRSDRVGNGFATLLVIADDADYPRLALMAQSLTRGAADGFALPVGGRLAALYGGALLPKGEKPEAQGIEPRARRALQPKDAESTGSGFYVNAANIVTAAHVVHGCRAMSLSDGSPVAVVLADEDLDLAVLQPAQGSKTWLNLQPQVRPRLGETVYALGYPYLGLLNQGLAVTGGNVSALGGIDVGEVRIMVSAPVQPGNSGGPLVNAQGDVVGVVVSRIDDMSIYDQTGTLPQNMNFAVPPAALVEFLDRANVTPTPVTAAEIDIARGLPDEMRDAVVPLFCY